MEKHSTRREHRTDERLLVPAALASDRPGGTGERERRDGVERELDAFSASVAEERARLEGAYAQAMEAVHRAEREGLDPLSDAATRKAYLGLQALHGQLETAIEAARGEAARLRSELDEPGDNFFDRESGL